MVGYSLGLAALGLSLLLCKMEIIEQVSLTNRHCQGDAHCILESEPGCPVKGKARQGLTVSGNITVSLSNTSHITSCLKGICALPFLDVDQVLKGPCGVSVHREYSGD